MWLCFLERGQPQTDRQDYKDLQVRVVRIFNTYGPRMALDDGRVVSNFVTQALTGVPLTIYGDGQQTRSFQYISDLIEGKPSLTPSVLRRISIWDLGQPQIQLRI